MPHNHPESIPESTYPSLTPPQFTSQIPEYLLKGASDQDLHVMKQLSVMAQISEWSIKAHISTMESVRKTNGRLIRAEEDIKNLQEEGQSAKIEWKTIGKIVGGVMAVLTLAALVYEALHAGG